jgi:hypothetical protein
MMALLAIEASPLPEVMLRMGLIMFGGGFLVGAVLTWLWAITSFAGRWAVIQRVMRG